MTKDKNDEVRATEAIRKIGIPAHIKGYHYIRKAILLAVSDMTILNSITNGLYPAIAKEFDTEPTRVERAIRHAIGVAWGKETQTEFRDCFGYSKLDTDKKPTNSEFIATIADKIRLDRI